MRSFLLYCIALYCFVLYGILFKITVYNIKMSATRPTFFFLATSTFKQLEHLLYTEFFVSFFLNLENVGVSYSSPRMHSCNFWTKFTAQAFPQLFLTIYANNNPSVAIKYLYCIKLIIVLLLYCCIVAKKDNDRIW